MAFILPFPVRGFKPGSASKPKPDRSSFSGRNENAVCPRPFSWYATLVVCTVTWWNAADGYEVFFNRDERKTRREALPPSPHRSGTTRYLAPVDPESGGTWLSVNAHGLTVGLLNLYEEEGSLPEAAGPWRSRGLLVGQLAGCQSIAELAETLLQLDTASFNAFTLLAFEPGPPFSVAQWQNRPCTVDGSNLSGPVYGPPMPISSSSFATREVIDCRRTRFREQVGERACTPADLDRFHHFDGGGNPSARTVLMNRSDAQTWCISHVRVKLHRIILRHEALPLDLRGPSTTSEAVLPRPVRIPGHV